MRSYLDGALTVQRLGANDGAQPFRAGDARGAVAWLVRGTPFSYLHAVEFAAAGDRRGFHAHSDHTEHFYLFSGALRLLARAGEAAVEVDLSDGDLAIFAPGTAHGLVARAPSFAIAYGSGADPIQDTAPADLADAR
jgi:quercetin dioxygenase-like cupin family protein